jgi:hypothetical protein
MTSKLQLNADTADMRRHKSVFGGVDITITDCCTSSLANAIGQWTYKKELFLLLADEILDWVESTPAIKQEMKERLNEG